MSQTPTELPPTPFHLQPMTVSRVARITAARQRLAELLDADTYDCATLHTAARDLLNALEG